MDMNTKLLYKLSNYWFKADFSYIFVLNDKCNYVSKNFFPTLLDAISDTDRWVCIVSNCSKHQSSSSRVSIDNLTVLSSVEVGASEK